MEFNSDILPSQASGNALQVCNYLTGHSVRNVAFCDTEELAKAIVKACRSHDASMALIHRIGNLNRDAGEIGAGMLAGLIDDARAIVAISNN